jgi:hypothetical protein
MASTADPEEWSRFPEPLPVESGMLVQPARPATGCEFVQVRKRAGILIGFRPWIQVAKEGECRFDIILTPNSSCECQEAYRRVLRIAHVSAAVLWGEKPTDDPERDASGRALLLATGMMYFLLRIDPEDARLLFMGKGSLGDLDYKPYPPGYFLKKGAFAALMR